MSRRITQGAPSYSETEPGFAGLMNDPGAQAQTPIVDCSGDIADADAAGDQASASVLGQSPDPEMLNDGQEEVFSREEVERGRIEHATEAGEPPTGARDGQESA